MSTYSRRDFIRGSAAILGAAALSGLPLGCRTGEMSVSHSRGGFRYAMCNECMAKLDWVQQCRIIGDAGYEGVEIAPFSLVESGVQEITPARRREMVSAMKNAGIECVGLHWLLAPPPKGLHFTTPDAAVRQKTLDYFDMLIDFCGDLGGPYMIFGSPRQRNAVGISVEQARKHFIEGLAQVADHARQRGVEILIEPLGKNITDVVNTMAEARDLARQVDHPAVKIMFDFRNTTDETKSFEALIEEYFDHIHHIHVVEADGRHLGTGTAARDYVKAFQKLKDFKYERWISLEVFDFSPGPKTIAEESIRVLRQIESKLV